MRCPDEPDASEFEPLVRLDDLEIECPVKSRRKHVYDTGRRLRPPDQPWDFTPTVRYLVLAGILTVVLIILIESLLL